MVAVFGWGLTCAAETVSDTNHYYDIDISLIQSDNYKPPFLHDLLHRLMIDRIYTLHNFTPWTTNQSSAWGGRWKILLRPT
jgi:hypothetical protein